MVIRAKEWPVKGSDGQRYINDLATVGNVTITLAPSGCLRGGRYFLGEGLVPLRF